MLNLAHIAARRRFGNWTPFSLFVSGEEGGWYDPSSLATLFQDSSKTTPVASTGDPTGAVEDRTGNTNDLLQTVSAARPTYTVDGTYKFVDFDGIDDAFDVTFPDLGTDATVAYVNEGEITIIEDQTISGAYNPPTDNWHDLVVLDRALTTPEAASLIKYFKTKSPVEYAAIRTRMDVVCLNAVDVLVWDATNDSDSGAWVNDPSNQTVFVPKAQMMVVANATTLVVYDATSPDLPILKTFTVGASNPVFAAPLAIDALEGNLVYASASGTVVMNLISDVGTKYTTGADETYDTSLGTAGSGWS